jgi:hypothetical protein
LNLLACADIIEDAFDPSGKRIDVRCGHPEVNAVCDPDNIKLTWNMVEFDITIAVRITRIRYVSARSESVVDVVEVAAHFIPFVSS